MKTLEVIYDSPWDFVLYQTDEGFVMNVEYSNSAVDYSRSFKIDSEEANQGFEALKRLSNLIRSNYESYKDREITPVVTKAKD